MKNKSNWIKNEDIEVTPMEKPLDRILYGGPIYEPGAKKEEKCYEGHSPT
jgi:hypothetical protein